MEYPALSTQYTREEAAVISPPRKIAKKSQESPGFEERRALLALEEKRELVSATTAGKMLGKSRDTIYRWLSEGRLSGRRVGGRWLVYKDTVEKEWEAGLVGQEEN